jgi:hypothetical protein
VIEKKIKGPKLDKKNYRLKIKFEIFIETKSLFKSLKIPIKYGSPFFVKRSNHKVPFSKAQFLLAPLPFSLVPLVSIFTSLPLFK